MWKLSARPMYSAVLLVLIPLVLTACGGDSDPVTPPPPVSVTLSPIAVTVGAGGAQEFTATVSHATDSGVNWSSTGGSIAGSGSTVTWTAPVEGGSYTVTATSVEDAEASASASVTVTGVSVSVTPASVDLFRGQPTTFTATVSGAAPGSTEVEWTATCGDTSAEGSTLTFQAPQTPGDCEVTATSTLDGSQSASGTVTVRPEWLVTSTDDTNDGECTFEHCSLREALLAANESQEPDVILLGVDSPALAPGGASNAMSVPPLSGTIVLSSSLPTITRPVTIAGPGAEALTIDADASPAQQRRVLWVSGEVAVNVSGLTLRGARAGEGAGIRIEGGADVTLRDLVVTDNESLSGPGGGGIGILGTSSVELEDVVVDGNTARGNQGNGGGIGISGSGEVVIRGGRIVSNVAEGEFGGGLVATGGVAVLLEGVEVMHNEAIFGAGLAVWNGGGSLTVLGGIVAENAVSSMTDGSGGGIIVGTSGYQAVDRLTVLLSDVLIEKNVAVVQGGGVMATRNVDLVLDRVVVRENTVSGQQTQMNFPSLGSGLMIGAGVSLEVHESTIDSNVNLATARPDRDGGGGIGMMALEAPEPSTATISRSTISGNESANRGGGILSLGLVELTVTNSTLSGNQAMSGGGIQAETPATLRNVSVVGNTAGFSGGGVQSQGGGIPDFYTGGELTLNSVLLADNRVGTSPGNCATGGGGSIATGGHNLRDDGSCGSLNATSDMVNTVPGVDLVLADHGGPTRTHALLDGSPAIDSGDEATCSTTDQRGAERVGPCDIGAFEFGGVPGVTPDAIPPVFLIQGRPIGRTGGPGETGIPLESSPSASSSSAALP